MYPKNLKLYFTNIFLMLTSSIYGEENSQAEEKDIFLFCKTYCTSKACSEEPKLREHCQKICTPILNKIAASQAVEGVSFDQTDIYQCLKGGAKTVEADAPSFSSSLSSLKMPDVAEPEGYPSLSAFQSDEKKLGEPENRELTSSSASTPLSYVPLDICAAALNAEMNGTD